MICTNTNSIIFSWIVAIVIGLIMLLIYLIDYKHILKYKIIEKRIELLEIKVRKMNWAEDHFWSCMKCLKKYSSIPIMLNNLDGLEWKCVREQILAECIGFV